MLPAPRGHRRNNSAKSRSPKALSRPTPDAPPRPDTRSPLRQKPRSARKGTPPGASAVALLFRRHRFRPFPACGFVPRSSSLQVYPTPTLIFSGAALFEIQQHVYRSLRGIRAQPVADTFIVNRQFAKNFLGMIPQRDQKIFVLDFVEHIACRNRKL